MSKKSTKKPKKFFPVILLLVLGIIYVSVLILYVCWYRSICELIDFGTFWIGSLAYIGSSAVAVFSFWANAQSKDTSDTLFKMEKAKALVLLKTDFSGENAFMRERFNEHHITLCFKNQGGGVAKTAKVVRFEYCRIKPQNKTKETKKYKEEYIAHEAKAPNFLLEGEELKQAHEAWKKECTTWDKRERELLNEIEFFSATPESYEKNVFSYVLSKETIPLSLMTKQGSDPNMDEAEKETLIQLGKKQPDASPMLFKIEFVIENSLGEWVTETCSFFAVASLDPDDCGRYFIKECATGKKVYELKPKEQHPHEKD